MRVTYLIFQKTVNMEFNIGKRFYFLNNSVKSRSRDISASELTT